MKREGRRECDAERGSSRMNRRKLRARRAKWRWDVVG
jgi:hypothetical protein